MYKKLILVLAAISFSVGAIAQRREAKPEKGIEQKQEIKAMAEQGKSADTRQQNDVAINKFLENIKSKLTGKELDFIEDAEVRKKIYDTLMDDTQSSNQKYLAALIISSVHEGETRSKAEMDQIRNFILNTPGLLDLVKNDKNVGADVAIKIFFYTLRMKDGTKPKFTVEKVAEMAIRKAFPELKGDDLLAKIKEFLNSCLTKAKA